MDKNFTVTHQKHRNHKRPKTHTTTGFSSVLRTTLKSNFTVTQKIDRFHSTEKTHVTLDTIAVFDRQSAKLTVNLIKRNLL